MMLSDLHVLPKFLFGRVLGLMSNQRGCPTQDAKVLALTQQGKPPSIIAAKLRRTVSAVRSRREKLFAGQARKASEPIPTPHLESRQ